MGQSVPLPAPRRVVPRDEIVHLLRGAPLDAELLAELRDMDVDEEDPDR